MVYHNKIIDVKLISSGELVVKVQNIFSMKENTDWYWGQHPLQHAIIVQTRTIIHPRLDVVRIIDVQDIPKSAWVRIHETNPYKDILFFWQMQNMIIF